MQNVDIDSRIRVVLPRLVKSALSASFPVPKTCRSSIDLESVYKISVNSPFENLYA